MVINTEFKMRKVIGKCECNCDVYQDDDKFKFIFTCDKTPCSVLTYKDFYDLVDKESFNELVSSCIDEIFDNLGSIIDIPIICEEEPSQDMIDEANKIGLNLLGSYGYYVGDDILTNHSLTHIRLFRKNILKHPKATSVPKIRHLIIDILLHELGHAFAIPEDVLVKLEQESKNVKKIPRDM